jgi:Ca-activated chloride channel homolog
MDRRLAVALLFVCLALAGLVGPVKADGIIVPDPVCVGASCPPCPKGQTCPVPPLPRPIAALEIKYHHVSVKIDNQVAVTHVDQVFHNPNKWTLEGTYTFPLPADAAVTRFTLWVDGQPVDGKVLDAAAARQFYEETVRQQKDPALLEYVGRGAVQARIFPIPPDGDRRIELEYSQVLSADHGLVHYVYPLNTEKFSAAPLDSASVSVQIHDDQPLQAIYSPSHAVSVAHGDEHNASAGWEAARVKPDQDFSLYYSIGQNQDFHLLSYRNPQDPQDPDGFFLMLLAPKPELPDQVISKDVILVLDHSGSMEGAKFTQAQAALKYILGHLNDSDRFGLVSFSTAVEPYARGLRSASEAPTAVRWVDGLRASGSTDINLALLNAVAMADKERPTYLIFLTDGLPTIGETKADKIIGNFAAAAPNNVRLFAFGVGYDVDTYLLDTLSQQHHGLSTYVQPSDKLDEILSSFYERISTPVLTDLSVDFGKMNVYDLYPFPLPDLFAGGQVIVVGRYRQGGSASASPQGDSADITLKGSVNGQAHSFTFPGQSFATDSRGASIDLSNLSRLWATRKIGYLLNQVRLKGADKETIDQIVKLSIRYGIVTPYTSYLVTEPSPLGAESQQHMAQDALRAAQAPQASSGAGAVNKAAGQGALSQAEQAPALSQDVSQVVAAVGPRTFVLSQGIWTDTTYDPQKMTTTKVAFLSADYFKLSALRADIAAALALGQKVIVMVDGKAYEVVADGASVPTAALPATLAPTAVKPSATPRPQNTATSSSPVTGTPVPTMAVVSAPQTKSGEWLPGAGAAVAVVGLLGMAVFVLRRRR